MTAYLSLTGDPRVSGLRERLHGAQQLPSGPCETFVIAVPSGEHDGTGEPLYDYYVLCACGWCSLPDIVRPLHAHCEACEARARGHRNFEEFFVPQAGRRGYAVLERREGQQ